MLATHQGKKVVLSSNGQSLMIMANLLGKTKSSILRQLDESMAGMFDLLQTRHRVVSKLVGSLAPSETNNLRPSWIVDGIHILQS
jgi:hypothetical protein